ncbi:unnamed protein product [Mesocestoides corti]|nr:unnamed protein product [Mesocestoides corti]
MARQKSTRHESTAVLRAWFREHQHHPYPTKAEKVMLSLAASMTMKQVSTWFANTRRRRSKSREQWDDAVTLNLSVDAPPPQENAFYDYIRNVLKRDATTQGH